MSKGLTFCSVYVEISSSYFTMMVLSVARHMLSFAPSSTPSFCFYLMLLALLHIVTADEEMDPTHRRLLRNKRYIPSFVVAVSPSINTQ